MSISAFFNDLWQPACGGQDLRKQSGTTHQTTSGEKATLHHSSRAKSSTSSTSVQKPQGASKQVTDLEYGSPASSERFQYGSQNEKQDLVDVEYVSPALSEKFQYRAYNEDERFADAKCTPPYTSDRPQNEGHFKFPCGLFQDQDHWTMKDWVAAVAVVVVCLVLPSYGQSNRPHDREDDPCDECFGSWFIEPCVPCFGMCGIVLRKPRRGRQPHDREDDPCDECFGSWFIEPCVPCFGMCGIVLRKPRRGRQESSHGNRLPSKNFSEAESLDSLLSEIV